MEILIIILALLFAGIGGWPVAAAILRGAGNVSTSNPLERDAEKHTPRQAQDSPAGEQDITPVQASSILRGGLVIGILERLCVAFAVLTGESVAIAYVIAIKGLGRYPELRETPGASERFIIGTLASLLWAVAVTAPVRIWFL
ncbi:hypothetical protein [Arthrobacter roseus]|uniref:hypothetical protein n=1 Tax=Arthrobacter roseus TaxID=136274 RepID=UPI0019645058|nr:hypothetical protein [Arthrobacter roseus]MBM7848203.1 hypothetical protein [Arthrobacter roseus]